MRLSLGVAFGLGAGAAEAAAKVEFRSMSCYSESSSNDTDTLTVTKPAGTSAGDLLLASVTALDHDSAVAPPSGWTMVLDNDPGADGTATFRKLAGSAEPATYTFTHPDADISIVAMSAFSGVDPAAPLAVAPAASTGSGSPWTLPNATSGRWGSMRYSAVSSDSVVTSTFQPSLTEACDRSELSKSLATAWEPINSGTSPSRTVMRSGTSTTIGHTLILQPLACGAGALSLSSPPTVSFPPTTLTGFDQILTATPTFAVNDQRGSGAGWNLTGTSTTFHNGSVSLPPTATRIVSSSPTGGTGLCEAPVNTVAYPVTLPAAAVAPTATTLFSAEADSGLGPVDVVLNTQLALPAHTRAGTYTSTWTFTLATGP